MTYDLHLHSCLSPCAADDATPASIAGFARLNGIELIAVTDHNSALNLPAAKTACDAYGVRLLPGIEVNTAEEIHLLTYFATVEKALEMGRALYRHLPAFPYDSAIWGNQLVMDADDAVTGRVGRLLTGAVTLGIAETAALCRGLGGVPVPAHIDRDSYSLLGVLGFAPEDLPFDAYEVCDPGKNLAALLAAGRLPAGREILSSSDAHTLADISEAPGTLAGHSCLRRLL